MINLTNGPGITVGILGVGHLAEFILQGIARADTSYRFIFSPRNHEKAQSLSVQYNADVASSNQDVVDRADIVMICLPTNIGLNILTDLTFRQDQIVLSAMAGIGHEELAIATSPAVACCTMMPGHANAYGRGPSVLYPANYHCEAFLQHLGPVHVFDDGEIFGAACIFGALSGASFVFMQHIISWFEDRGVPENTARKLIVETLIGNAHVVGSGDQPLTSIIKGVTTPGGITQQYVDFVDAHGAMDVWRKALDAVFKRTKHGME